MPRTAYTELPAAVRRWVDDVLGSQVTGVLPQQGGWSPGAAARVRCADGRRGFVKALSAGTDGDSLAMYRTETLVTRRLPAALGSPRLLGGYDDGAWVALVLEDVPGRTPVVPDDLPAVLRALDRLALVPAPPGIRPAAESLAEDFFGWRRLALAPTGLTSWQDRHLDALVALEAGWPAAAAGDRLLHLDLRPDNMILRPDAEIVFVDWPWAAAGSPVLDLVCLLPSLVLLGAGPAELLLTGSGVGRDADAAALTCLLAAFCGRMEEHARRPVPPALPGLRSFQAAQARVAGAWLRQRLGWA